MFYYYYYVSLLTGQVLQLAGKGAPFQNF